MAAKKNHEFLLNLGFGENEARAYYALLEKSPANGYEVSIQSGIPRSKVYQALEKLVMRGAAVRVENDKKNSQLFAPTDPYALIEDIEHDMNRNCNTARETINRFDLRPSVAEIFWRILSIEEMVVRAADLIEEAQSTLHVALWPNEFNQVFSMLKDALNRKVKIALVLYNPHEGLAELQEKGAGAILHERSKLKSTLALGRQFVLVCDSKKCITGTVTFDNTVDGAYTLNKGVVINALDLVNHEIYLERVMEVVGVSIKSKFGDNLEFLNPFDPIK